MTDPLTFVVADGAPNLAIDVQPDGIAGTFVLDVAELDGHELLGWGDGEDQEWLNVVCDVTSVHTRRGATRLQGPLTRAEAGTATVEVIDYGRRFDPMLNADAIHAGTPVRVRAWGVDPEPWSAVLFTAQLDDVPVTYPRFGPPRVTLTAYDVIADLAGWQSVGRETPGVGAGDDLLGRVSRVLTEVGLPQTVLAEDLDETYSATLAPTVIANAWETVTDAADAELGRVWVDASNRLVVRARESLLTGPVRGTLSDWHGETVEPGPEVHCCYAELDATLGTENITNRAIAARRVPAIPGGAASTSAVVQVDDLGSQAVIRRVRATERRDLDLERDDQLEPWAESLLTTSSRPELRIDRLAPAPWAADAAAWQAVLATDIGDRWFLRYHPEIGPTVRRTVGVLGIEHDITPDGWSMVWTLTNAPTPDEDNPEGWFVLDVSDLDEDDVLTPQAVLTSSEPGSVESGGSGDWGDGIIDGGGPGSW